MKQEFAGMKKILCHLRVQDPDLLTEIHASAKKYGWLLETTNNCEMNGWFGDGVLSDYFSLEELNFIRNIHKIPVISREIHPEPNIYSVIGNTNTIAELAFRHFAEKGYTVFATISVREWPGGLPDIPHDPVLAFRTCLQNKGIFLHQCFLDPHYTHQKSQGYVAKLARVKKFLQELPKPAAVFLTSDKYLTTIYRVIFDLHLRVPEDVAVLCNTEDITTTDNAIISTSRISGANRETGRKMCALLNDLLTGANVPQKTVLVTPTTIISRHSTDALVVPDAAVTEALHFLQSNYNQFISVKDAADYAGLSICVLNKKFKLHLGKTLYQYLLELRISKIRDLLDRSSMSLYSIAKQTGYGSKMALSLAFKRVIGITPGKYRQKRLLVHAKPTKKKKK